MTYNYINDKQNSELHRLVDKAGAQHPGTILMFLLINSQRGCQDDSEYSGFIFTSLSEVMAGRSSAKKNKNKKNEDFEYSIIYSIIKIDIILSWKSLHGLTNTSRNHVCEHNSPCNPQMQVKAVSYKDETISDSETPCNGSIS